MPCSAPASGLPRALIERVLERLGFSTFPAADVDGLSALYAAWCRKVPFDNIQKLLHLRAGDPRPLPGDEPGAFLETWLASGTGGTCWAGNGALHAVLLALGFSASRGIGTMLAVPDAPPNHGTVLVDCAGRRYLVDASMLHGAPLALDAPEAAAEPDRPWGVTAACRDGRWHVRWRPLHLPEGMDCRLEAFAVTGDAFRSSHEQTRPWSPFNYELYVRSNRGEGVTGVTRGERVSFDASGAAARRALDADARMRVLIDELGIAEAVAARLPPDLPTPPPPWSRSAQAAAGQRG